MHHSFFLTSILCLIVACVLMGCEQKDVPTGKPGSVQITTSRTPHDPAVRYLALGDSYTIGQNVDLAERYPVKLAQLLRKQSIDLGEPCIIARTGWTTRDLLNAIAAENPSGPFDLVTVLIGVNNQFQGRHIAEYRKELVEILKKAIALANEKPSHVVAFSIPDWGVTPFASNANAMSVATEIDAFNKVKAEECAKLGIELVDVTAISRTAPQHPDLLADDGLHPSGRMYTLWAEAALPTVIKAVQSR